MAFPALLDTCTIYGAGLSDLLLTLAERGTYRPLWSAAVCAELKRVLVEDGCHCRLVMRTEEMSHPTISLFHMSSRFSQGQR